jgi:hypothetical protein
MPYTMDVIRFQTVCRFSKNMHAIKQPLNVAIAEVALSICQNMQIAVASNSSAH